MEHTPRIPTERLESPRQEKEEDEDLLHRDAFNTLDAIASMIDKELAVEIFDDYFARICSENAAELASSLLNWLITCDHPWLKNSVTDNVIILYGMDREVGARAWIKLITSPETHHASMEILDIALMDHEQLKDRVELERLLQIQAAADKYLRLAKDLEE